MHNREQPPAPRLPPRSIPVCFRVEELQRLATRHRGGSSGGGDGGGDKRKGRQQRGSGVRGWEGDELAHRLALQTMENYARSLRVRTPGTKVKVLRQS